MGEARHILVCFGLLLSCQTMAGHQMEHHDGRSDSRDFSNEWVVHLEGDVDSAELIALKLGFECLGEIRGFPNHFLMRKLDHPEVVEEESRLQTRSLEGEFRVLWAQQMFSKTRVKRRPEQLNDLRLLEEIRKKGIQEALREHRLFIDIRSLMDEDERGIPPELLEIWEEEEEAEAKSDNDIPFPKERYFNDELWDHQWYMQDTRTTSDLPKLSLNVLQVFELGYTGKNVRISIIDDGLEHTHNDIQKNYDPEISYDFNNGTNGDPDPTPRYPEKDGDVPNSHGTRCAGEIAMIANNRLCGVGVAHDARIGGIRMLDGKINDKIEGMSLQHAIDKVDIFTASWGPRDDGKTVEAPGRMAQLAFQKGVKEGRNGKGIIYVWASGNGGMNHDNCNCDGYTSSIYTISIGSASEQGQFPWYGEMCSSTMASTYSSGAYHDQKIATIDINNTCTVSHTGTSAAAPLAAGIIALGLEANPNLNWRDVQHLIAHTADPGPVINNPGWKVNGAGLKYNSRFGFGVMDALRFVQEAKSWKTVPQQHAAHFPPTNMDTNVIKSQGVVETEFKVPELRKIKFVEHVQIKVSIEYPVRGNLEVALMSPSGTISQLLTVRPNDKSDEGFKDWFFMTVHFWGENPEGRWILYIVDKTSNNNLQGKVGEPTLILYGTATSPETMQSSSAKVP